MNPFSYVGWQIALFFAPQRITPETKVDIAKRSEGLAKSILFTPRYTYNLRDENFISIIEHYADQRKSLMLFNSTTKKYFKDLAWDYETIAVALINKSIIIDPNTAVLLSLYHSIPFFDATWNKIKAILIGNSPESLQAKVNFVKFLTDLYQTNEYPELTEEARNSFKILHKHAVAKILTDPDIPPEFKILIRDKIPAEPPSAVAPPAAASPQAELSNSEVSQAAAAASVIVPAPAQPSSVPPSVESISGGPSIAPPRPVSPPAVPPAASPRASIPAGSLSAEPQPPSAVAAGSDRPTFITSGFLKNRVVQPQSEASSSTASVPAAPTAISAEPSTPPAQTHTSEAQPTVRAVLSSSASSLSAGRTSTDLSEASGSSLQSDASSDSKQPLPQEKRKPRTQPEIIILANRFFSISLIDAAQLIAKELLQSTEAEQADLIRDLKKLDPDESNKANVDKTLLELTVTTSPDIPESEKVARIVTKHLLVNDVLDKPRRLDRNFYERFNKRHKNNAAMISQLCNFVYEYSLMLKNILENKPFYYTPHEKEIITNNIADFIAELKINFEFANMVFSNYENTRALLVPTGFTHEKRIRVRKEIKVVDEEIKEDIESDTINITVETGIISTAITIAIKNLYTNPNFISNHLSVLLAAANNHREEAESFIEKFRFFENLIETQPGIADMMFDKYNNIKFLQEKPGIINTAIKIKQILGKDGDAFINRHFSVFVEAAQNNIEEAKAFFSNEALRENLENTFTPEIIKLDIPEIRDVITTNAIVSAIDKLAQEEKQSTISITKMNFPPENNNAKNKVAAALNCAPEDLDNSLLLFPNDEWRKQFVGNMKKNGITENKDYTLQDVYRNPYPNDPSTETIVNHNNQLVEALRAQQPKQIMIPGPNKNIGALFKAYKPSAEGIPVPFLHGIFKKVASLRDAAYSLARKLATSLASIIDSSGLTTSLTARNDSPAAMFRAATPSPISDESASASSTSAASTSSDTRPTTPPGSASRPPEKK